MVGGSRRVVVADDDQALRLLCRINLEHEGFKVVEAECASDLMRAVDSDAVALVLLDIHLGADDGIAVARTLRETHPAVRIALLSGSIRELPQPVRALVDAVVSKPFTLDELSETVRRLASG